jgi:hypothetical protein
MLVGLMRRLVQGIHKQSLIRALSRMLWRNADPAHGGPSLERDDSGVVSIATAIRQTVFRIVDIGIPLLVVLEENPVSAIRYQARS